MGRNWFEVQRDTAEPGDKFSLGAAATEPRVMEEPTKGKLKQLGDTIEAVRQGVRWFLSCHQRLLADRKAQSGCYPILGADVLHGNAQDIG
ncbi:hypothetical protein OAF56_04255 [Pirellulaceae bacterium]|nr:hypothetical protein [Pirellulaceae bacterium]